MDALDKNARMNQYAKEPEAISIGSPFRIMEYCKLRLSGKSPKKALEIVRRNPKNK